MARLQLYLIRFWNFFSNLIRLWVRVCIVISVTPINKTFHLFLVYLQVNLSTEIFCYSACCMKIQTDFTMYVVTLNVQNGSSLFVYLIIKLDVHNWYSNDRSDFQIYYEVRGNILFEGRWLMQHNRNTCAMCCRATIEKRNLTPHIAMLHTILWSFIYLLVFPCVGWDC